MKKVLLIIALLISGLGLNAQSEGVNYIDYDVMTTTYDLQSNGFLANRMYQLKDGSVAVTAIMSRSEFDPSFLDRGTGYNFYDGNSWDGMPTERVEAKTAAGADADVRTGWPTIAPYGAEGEILVNHGHKNGLSYYIREKAGEGVWDGPYAIPNPEGVNEVVGGWNNVLAWPRIVTTGENNEVLHVFAAASGEVTTAQYYLRTTDLQNWDIQFAPAEMDGLHVGFYFADDYAVSANGENIAVVYNNWEKAHTMLYESNDGGLTWESRIVWENPIHGLDWFTDENSLFEKLYVPAQVSVAIGKDGVTHVALGVGLYDRTELGNSYMFNYGLITDGVAYWNDTITRWEGVPSPIRSSQDDDPKHALKLYKEDDWGDVISRDTTNFCAWIPNYNEFDILKQYTGPYITAWDYLLSFGLIAYPSIAVDPAGNIAVAYSAPDLTRFTKDGYYYRSMYVSYKAANSKEWQVGNNLYQTVKSNDRECVFVSAVSAPVNENEFWFSCLSDDIPGLYSSSNSSQTNISTSVVSAFKFTPEEEYKTFNITATVQPEGAGVVTGVGNYRENETVTLTATRNGGYAFVGWMENGVIVSIDAEYTFVVTNDRNLVANFIETYYDVTVDVNENVGSVWGLNGNKYKYGDIINLKAIPNENYKFVGWTENGEVVSYNEEYTFVVTDNRNLVANFVLMDYDVNITINPENTGFVKGFGNYYHGDTVTVTARANGFIFLNWTENGNVVSEDADYTFVITNDRNLVANFALGYNVTLISIPLNAGVVTGSGDYVEGDAVTITATPNAGYEFVGWIEDGALLSEDAEYSFVISNNRIILANFEQIEYDVTATVNSENNGAVIGIGTYRHGATVTLTAMPNVGYEFVSWTENNEVVSTDLQYSFTATSDREFVANFELIEYYVTAAVNATAAGEITGDGNYYHGDTVSMIATANIGYKFLNWTENGVVVSEDAEYLFVAFRDRELTANFVETEGVEELTASFNIYPNPVSDKLYIETQTLTLTIEIYDVYGRRQSMVNGQQSTVIDVSDLNSGVYFVKVVTSEGEAVKRFIKK